MTPKEQAQNIEHPLDVSLTPDPETKITHILHQACIINAGDIPHHICQQIRQTIEHEIHQARQEQHNQTKQLCLKQQLQQRTVEAIHVLEQAEKEISQITDYIIPG